MFGTNQIALHLFLLDFDFAIYFLNKFPLKAYGVDDLVVTSNNSYRKSGYIDRFVLGGSDDQGTFEATIKYKKIQP
ncbi:MAG: hypothetical protein EOP06_19960 [Proteobacteria bacterium]|nr:MAG: hypothetical protein EOP06_19960 [Pseudomonadota bacterium]